MHQYEPRIQAYCTAAPVGDIVPHTSGRPYGGVQQPISSAATPHSGLRCPMPCCPAARRSHTVLQSSVCSSSARPSAPSVLVGSYSQVQEPRPLPLTERPCLRLCRGRSRPVP
eukprot:scaffold59637_cov50-Phaeocystis_antarctica.AAC.6